jgi:hypothetical protein
MPLGRTNWYDRSPAKNLADQSIDIRQAITIGKVWEPIVSHDMVNFMLGLVLGIWEKGHGKIEGV